MKCPLPEVDGPLAQSPGHVQLARLGVAIKPAGVQPGVGEHLDVAAGPAPEVGHGGNPTLSWKPSM